MKFLNCVLKFFLWSLFISIGIRIVYGLYFEYFALSIAIAVVMGVVGGLIFSPASTTLFATITLLHITLVASLSYLYDYTGIFRSLPYDSADFFMRSEESSGTVISLVWPIITVTPVYFIVFIVISAIILGFRRKEIICEDEELPEETEFYE